MTDIPSLILQGIRDFSANRPRSMQKEIGPSGLGTACDHCLAAALVGWERVDVGTVAGMRVSGNADLFHVPSGTVVDLKIVGATTLNEARKNGASMQYRRQVQLYGRGFAMAGYQVNHCTIAYLPRNSMRLSDAVFSTYAYDVDFADDALNRAEKLLADARYLETSVSVRARDVWIDSLPRAAGCYDCARYPLIVPRKSDLQQYATTQGDNNG
jgi:hypothetical protein